MAIGIVEVFLMGITKIEEKQVEGKSSSFGECFSLLKDKTMLLFFIRIMCHVGIDVGTNVTAPKLLIEGFNMSIEDAGYATSVYFMFRTIGCFSGAFLLAIMPAKRIFTISIAMLIVASASLFFLHNQMLMYACIALIGLGNSDVFPIIMSQALLNKPDNKNEVSGLLIMGLCGGALFPLLMGLTTDIMQSQSGALIILSICIVYLLFVISKLKVINK